MMAAMLMTLLVIAACFAAGMLVGRVHPEYPKCSARCMQPPV